MVRFFFCLLLTLTTLCSNGQVVINELCAANGDVVYDPDYFEFPSWVELHNTGQTPVDVGGYFLSDNGNDPLKWQIPHGTTIDANGYLLIWCDERNSGYHPSFSLDADGEDVLLSTPAGIQVDKIAFPSQYLNTTYGRDVNDRTKFGYLPIPTPGEENVSTTAAMPLDPPVFKIQPGRFSAPQSLVISTEKPEAKVRYTLDGSEPTPSSTLYSAPVQISKTSVVKAKVFLDGYLPSATLVGTYFINEHASSLPVISLSTKPEYLVDNTIGIYVEGTNGARGNCADHPANWNRNWDRHALFEYYKDGKKALEQSVDIRVGGACSRNNPQKSLTVKARDKYGSKTIEHRFFNNKQISKFGGLMLRNSGNDFYSTAFRDGLIQNIPIGKMDVDYLSYQPAIVYINGEYWGIMNIREKIDADYIESNFAVGRDDLDLLESQSYPVEGTNDYYVTYLDSLQKIDLTAPDAFTFIDRHIDVQEFINYLTVETYAANTDWPANNYKAWRQRSKDSKLRWILWDLDFGLGLYSNQSWPTHPTLEFVTDPTKADWPNPEWATLHIRLLLQNPEFRNKFIQTMNTSLETIFDPDRLVQMINTFESRLQTEMPYHAQRWGLSVDIWKSEVERMRDFAVQRKEFLKDHFASFFGYGEDVRFSINTLPPSSGEVVLNGVKNESVDDGVYFKNLPFEVAAEAAPGYEFSHFKVRKHEAEFVKLIDKKSEWFYHDYGILPSPDWQERDYSDNYWAVGTAQLGYGEGDEAMEVNSGPESERYITTYFRKSFDVADTVGLSALQASVLFDDGIVVYLNGEEVWRANMPSGIISNTSRATQEQVHKNTFFSFHIPKGKVVPGRNVIAVEAHQFDDNSGSNLSFDFELTTVRSGQETELIIDDFTFSGLANSDVLVEAYFVPAKPISGLVINEIATQNKWYEDEHGDKDDWIELHNASREPIDIANLFVSDKLNNKVKHRIPRGRNNETIVEPGSYKLLWADGDVNQGPLHLSFKLSGDGEEFGIYQMIGGDVVKIDEVKFAKQPPNSSLSRIPDVTGDFITTDLPTPWESNVHRVSDAGDEDPVLMRPFRPFPNPFSKTFKIDTDNQNVTYSIFDSIGKIIVSNVQYRNDDEISLTDHPPGLYLLKIDYENIPALHRIIKIE